MLRLVLVFVLGYLVGSARKPRPRVDRQRVPPRSAAPPEAETVPSFEAPGFDGLPTTAFLAGAAGTVAAVNVVERLTTPGDGRTRNHFFIWVPGAPDPAATMLPALQFADTAKGLTCFTPSQNPFYVADFDILSQDYPCSLPPCGRLTDPRVDGTVYELQRRPL